MDDVSVLKYQEFNQSISEDRRQHLLEMAKCSRRGIYERQIEWRTRRKIRIEISRGRCEKCHAASETLHVHHLCYDNYGNENYQDLEVLCQKCHTAEHSKYPCLDRHHIETKTRLDDFFQGIDF